MTFIELYETLRANTDWERYPWRIGIPPGVIADMIEDLTDAMPIPDTFGELLRQQGLCTNPVETWEKAGEYHPAIPFGNEGWLHGRAWIRTTFLILPAKEEILPRAFQFIGWEEKGQ